MNDCFSKPGVYRTSDSRSGPNAYAVVALFFIRALFLIGRRRLVYDLADKELYSLMEALFRSRCCDRVPTLCFTAAAVFFHV